MTKSIHGHEVLGMMIDAQTPFTKESLEQAILKKFGPDARFYTCSAENMTAGDLIVFLEARGKFVGSGEGFSAAPDRICDHE